MTEETTREGPVEDSVPDKEVPARGKWANNREFLLSMVAAVFGIEHIWRFPYLCFKNGGAVFFIPYILSLMFIGMPMFFLETALGQFTSQGVVTAWRKICPMFEGVGVASLVILTYANIYFIVMAAWAILYLINSFMIPLPWSTCKNHWNTEKCHSHYNMYANPDMFHLGSNWSFLNNFTSDFLDNNTDMTMTDDYIPALTSPEMEFWTSRVLKLSADMSLSNVQWDLALCLLLAWIICYFCIWKGIKSMGKVMYFTATCPHLMLVILFFRGVTLPGSAEGLKYYLLPDLKNLFSLDAWTDAVTHVVYTYTLSFGVLIALGSYNKYNNNCYRQCFALCFMNSAYSFFACLVVSSVTGFMAYNQNVAIETVATAGNGLVFVAFPNFLSSIPGSNFWCIFFFFMILVMALNSQFVFVESLVTTITDMFPHHLRKPGRGEILALVICVVCFLLGLPLITEGGLQLFHVIDYFGCSQFTLFIIAGSKCVVIAWVYGADRFLNNITDMIGYPPIPVLKYCWLFITPLILWIHLQIKLSESVTIMIGDYQPGVWTYRLGGLMIFTALIFIPLYILVSMHRNFETMATPSSDLRQAWPHKPVLTLCKKVIFKAQEQPRNTMVERNEKMMMEKPIGV